MKKFILTTLIILLIFTFLGYKKVNAKTLQDYESDVLSYTTLEKINHLLYRQEVSNSQFDFMYKSNELDKDNHIKTIYEKLKQYFSNPQKYEKHDVEIKNGTSTTIEQRDVLNFYIEIDLVVTEGSTANDKMQIASNATTRAWHAFTEDYKQIYWIASVSTQISTTAQNNTISLKIMPNLQAGDTLYYNSVSKTYDTNLFKKEFNEFIAKKLYLVNEIINTQTSVYEKIKRAHDWLVTNNQYPEESLQSNFSHSPISGMLAQYHPVCEGYAEALQILLEHAGIPTIYRTGDAIDDHGNKIPHAWNNVLLDGTWYFIDATWADPINNAVDKVYYNYFLIPTPSDHIEYKLPYKQTRPNDLSEQKEIKPFATQKYNINDVSSKKHVNIIIDGLKNEYQFTNSQITFFNKIYIAETNRDIKYNVSYYSGDVKLENAPYQIGDYKIEVVLDDPKFQATRTETISIVDNSDLVVEFMDDKGKTINVSLTGLDRLDGSKILNSEIPKAEYKNLILVGWKIDKTKKYINNQTTLQRKDSDSNKIVLVAKFVRPELNLKDSVYDENTNTYNISSDSNYKIEDFNKYSLKNNSVEFDKYAINQEYIESNNTIKVTYFVKSKNTSDKEEITQYIKLNKKLSSSDIEKLSKTPKKEIVKEESKTMNDVLDFMKKNWMIIAGAVGALVFLIIIIAVVRKKR